jgi:hydroxymethylbilane synthase
MMASMRVGELTFSVDSGGSTPAFSKRILSELETQFGPEYAAAARTLARMRTYAKAVVPAHERANVLRALAALPIDRLARMNPVEGEHEVESAVESLRGETHEPTASAVCASRASALAMTQTRMVAARLAERGIATTILNVTTTGDRVQDRPIAAIGTDNVWIKELELALRDGRAHYAVHSCKDLPGQLEADMRLVAISRREDPRDAFCSERFTSFAALPPGAIVGTSSLRRRAQLQARRPDLRFEDIRGNVDTRLRKLREGRYDAIVLAMAGLKRLGASATHTLALSEDEIVPAVAQGALAVEMRIDGPNELARALHDAVNDRDTELAVACERAALRTLRAGCNAPLGIHARFVAESLVVDGAYALVDRNHVLRERFESPVSSVAQAEELGERLARALAAQISTLAPSKSVVLPRTQDRPSRIAAALRTRGVSVIELREGENVPENVTPDMLVFPSSGSVAAAQTYLAHLRTRNARRPFVAAMGPQSGAAARDAGFDPDLISPEASIDAFVALIEEQLESR